MSFFYIFPPQVTNIVRGTNSVILGGRKFDLGAGVLETEFGDLSGLLHHPVRIARGDYLFIKVTWSGGVCVTT